MANEDLLLRQMPHSLEGEQAVLGSMLIDEGCVKDVMDKLVPSDFYLRQNREIFETIYTMFTYARPIDGITVCEEMQKAGTYDENTTRSYLAQLMEITPTSANVMEYVAIVRDKALLRGVAQAAGEITVLVQEGIGEAAAILEAAEQKIYAVRRGQSAQDMVPLRMVLPDVLDRLNEMSESESRLPGLSTGLSAVDRKISGLNKSDLILLAARPGMGKTSFALNVALNVAKSEKKTVAMFSLEMSREQLATRLLSSEACVENTRLVTGSLRETDWEKIAAAAGVLNRVDIRIDDNPSVTVADINAKCRRYGVCNACETLLVHRDIAADFLPKLLPPMQEKHVRLLGDEATRAIIPVEAATEEDWRTEYLDYVLSIRVVDSLEAAIAHINRYGSHHTDCIVTRDDAAAKAFLTRVDSAGVYRNVSTRFADGFVYGFGAEVGIATGKLHARGPMGLDGLTTYKYKLLGDGQLMAEMKSGQRAYTHLVLHEDCPL